QHAFRVGVATSTLLVSAFYLAAMVGQPLMGRIADRFGPRRVYCAGLVIAGVAGVAALASPWFGWLVGCRVLQAVGTSAAFPAGLAMVRRIAGAGPPPAGTLAGISIANGTSAALGPLLGGLLVAAAGWRGIFVVNIPLAALGLILALRWLPPDHRAGTAAPGGAAPEPAAPGATGPAAPGATGPAAPGATGPAAPGGAAPAPALRTLAADLDLPGVALFAVTVFGLLGFLLSLATRPQWWLLALFPLTAALLAWQELRVPEPFLDLRTLGRNLPLLRT